MGALGPPPRGLDPVDPEILSIFLVHSEIGNSICVVFVAYP